MKSTLSILRQNLGVDVSKDTPEVVFSTIDLTQYVKVKASRSFANNLTGFKHLQQWIEANKASSTRMSKRRMPTSAGQCICQLSE